MNTLWAYVLGGAMLVATFWVAEVEWVPVLSDANLIFHEAGHAVLFWAPRTLLVLGGTLLQLAVPCVALFALLREGRWVSGGIVLWWLGQNLVNVGWYMADARAQALPLLGGNVAGHDWTYLLGQWGLLRHDTLLGGAVQGIGVATMAAASLAVWYVLLRTRKT